MDDGPRRDVEWWRRVWTWREIPESKGVEPGRAAFVPEQARSQAWRCGSVWLVIAAMVITYGGFAVGSRRLGSDYWFLSSLFKLALLAVWVWGGEYVRDFVLRVALRRCVRAELGTHCAGCDYDLRATPDRLPPAVARCPECGKRRPRNVHRRTITSPGRMPHVPQTAAGVDGGRADGG